MTKDEKRAAVSLALPLLRTNDKQPLAAGAD
jgi:hypothetical protein